MKKSEKLSIGLSFTALLMSSLSTWYIFYFNSLKKIEHLSITPLEFRAKYDNEGWSYSANFALINKGNVELIVSNFHVTFNVPTGDSPLPARAFGDSWEIKPIILKPNDSILLSNSNKNNWPKNNGLSSDFYKLPGPNITKTRVEFAYQVLSTEGKVRKKNLPIDTRNGNGYMVITEGIRPYNETLEGFPPTAPQLLRLND